VPAGDEHVLAQAFIKATSDFPASRLKAAEIQRFVVENFAPKVVVDSYLRLYKQLLGG
jgi:glycosyltransferase involved in cell wall biosynthesis